MSVQAMATDMMAMGDTVAMEVAMGVLVVVGAPLLLDLVAHVLFFVSATEIVSPIRTSCSLVSAGFWKPCFKLCGDLLAYKS